jgi:hypothetical protein
LAQELTTRKEKDRRGSGVRLMAEYRRSKTRRTSLFSGASSMIAPIGSSPEVCFRKFLSIFDSQEERVIPEMPDSWEVSLLNDAGLEVKGERRGGNQEFCLVILVLASLWKD